MGGDGGMETEMEEEVITAWTIFNEIIVRCRLFPLFFSPPLPLAQTFFCPHYLSPPAHLNNLAMCPLFSSMSINEFSFLFLSPSHCHILHSQRWCRGVGSKVVSRARRDPEQHGTVINQSRSKYGQINKGYRDRKSVV